MRFVKNVIKTGMSLSKITMLIDGQEELTTTQKEKRVGIVNVKDAVVQKILVRHRNVAACL